MSNFRDAHPDGKRKKARSAGTRRTHEEREILHLTPAALWFLHAVISPRLQIKGGEWTELNIARIAARKDAKFSERAIRTGLVRLRACAPILGLKFRRQYKQGGKRGRCHLGWLVADVAWLHERKTDEEPLFWTGTKRRHIKDENREPVEPKPYGLLKPAQARQEGHWKTAVKASAPGPSIFLGGDDHPAHSAPHTPYHEQPIGNHSRVTRTSRRAKRPRQDSVALLPASTLSEKQRRWSFFEARSRCEPHSESVNRVQLADADAECGDGRCLATITLNSFRHCVALALANGLPPPPLRPDLRACRP